MVSWGQLSWLCPLPASCPPPAYLLGGAAWEKDKALTLWAHCSAIAKTLVCHQQCFSHKSKAQYLTGCSEENELQLSQTQHKK